jgi:hypothetical protein
MKIACDAPRDAAMPAFVTQQTLETKMASDATKQAGMPALRCFRLVPFDITKVNVSSFYAIPWAAVIKFNYFNLRDALGNWPPQGNPPFRHL